MKGSFFAHGKLLITGEYVVLDGATAFAIPLKYGQHLKVGNTRGCDIVWEAMDRQKNNWFKARISLFDFSALKTTDAEIADKLKDILEAACRLNSDFLSTWKGSKIKTTLDFPLEYGWGSSSTLVHSIAQWAEVDPYELHNKTFGGSGYDIACAGSKKPIKYAWNNNFRMIEETDWLPNYIDQMHVVYLGKKKNTQEAIAHYNSIQVPDSVIQDISDLTEEFIQSESLSKAQEIITAHENKIASLLNQPSINDAIFKDFNGVAKSLGAWGGDFALLLTDESVEYVRNYVQKKSLSELYPLKDIMLPSNVAVV